MSLISKKHLSMAIQSLKSVFNRKIKDSTADWNQNDASADNYVKNKPFYEETNRITLVDNLTMEDYYDDNNVPRCNFVPDQTYDVIWNGTLYEGLVCWTDGDYNIISPEDHSTPFYIDDDGGDGLYISGEVDEDDNTLPYTVSILTTETVIHKLDTKYLPDGIGVQSDWNENDESSKAYIQNKPFGLVETVLFEDTITTDQSGSYDFEPDLNLITGQEYACVINGASYSGICYWDDVDGNCFPLKDSDDNYVGWVYRYGMYLYDSYFNVSSSYDVKICQQEIQKIDEVYLPDSVATDADVVSLQSTLQTKIDTAQTTADSALTNAATAQTTADSKMNKTNPTGSGYFSLNRQAASDIAPVSSNSYAIGEGTVANRMHMMTQGMYNKYEDDLYAVAESDEKLYGLATSTTVWCSNKYTLNQSTSSIKLVDPVETIGGNLNTINSYQYILVSGRPIARRTREVVKGTNSILLYYANLLVVDAKNTKGKYSHIVGNGTADTSRSNAYTLDWEGNAWYSGNVYVGSTSGTDKDEGSKKLATEEYVNSTKPFFTLTDSITNYEYIIRMQNGNLTSTCKVARIEVTTMPTKTEYISGEPFDPIDMVVTAIYYDGTTKIVENYEYNNFVTTNNASAFEIRYTEYGTTYTTTIELITPDIGSSLSDFTYTVEEDGTYTLTGWNGTLNGVESTECIIPNSDKINL